jgi:hypothetical protein
MWPPIMERRRSAPGLVLGLPEETLGPATASTSPPSRPSISRTTTPPPDGLLRGVLPIEVVFLVDRPVREVRPHEGARHDPDRERQSGAGDDRARKVFETTAASP